MSLFRNEEGNVLSIFAAALVPLVLVIGSGVDVSRMYMVKTRLQQACDAGVLAARKAVSDEGSYNTAARNRGTELFDSNFDDDYQQSFDVAFTQSSSNNGSTIDGRAVATVPMALMHIIGNEQATINVECAASMEMSNVDITMVLDTTGSMSCPESYSSGACSTYINDNGLIEGLFGTTSRLKSLRTAVVNFYDTLAAAVQGTSARVRYAFVPYSMTVNTGWQLRAQNVSYIDTQHPYQSREWVTEIRREQVCIRWWNNGSCREYQWQDVPYSYWQYKQRTYNLANYIAGTSGYPNGNNGSNVTYSWAGCIHERPTTHAAASAINFSASTGWSPAGMEDVNIDWVPANSSQGWAPYFPQIAYGRNSNSASTSGWTPQSACPAQARVLATATRTQVVNYTNSLTPNGGTYHSIGMIWGGRFASPDGPFGSVVNADPPNGAFVSSHVIFMTDGEMDTSSSGYTAWGIDRLDKNINNAGNTDNGAHEARFVEVCEAIRSKGIRVWVIAFGTGLTTALRTCASQDSAFAASNASQLNAAFQTIADTVGDLRIVK